MIVQVVKCDKCGTQQEKDGPLAEGDRPIQEYSIGKLHRHLCDFCHGKERELLAGSVWADALGLKASEGFAALSGAGKDGGA